MKAASWPAREMMSRLEKPATAAAALRTAAMQSGSKVHAPARPKIVLIAISSPSSAPILLGGRGDVAFHAGRARSLSGSRRSMVKNTSPGMTLVEPGLTSRMPTVPTASGWRARGGVDRFDHAGGAEQGVVAARHRRGAGMAVLAGDGHFEPAHRLHAGDDADVLALGFEKRALLDMHFEERRQRMIAARLAARDSRWRRARRRRSRRSGRRARPPSRA